jgi:ABC-type multidrug transport system fused ATPase/permease subunit
MALLFGMALPAGPELSALLEGWGLHVADAPDPTAELRHIPLPPIAAARGELRGAMALSFVKFLLERGSEQFFRRLLTEAQPGQVEVTAQQIYGVGLSALEEQWQQAVAAGSARDIKAGQFLRMSMRYLRPHRLRVVEILLLAGLGIAFSTVALPLATKRLVDSALPTAVRTVSFSPIASVLGMVVAVAVLSSLAQLRSAYASAYVSSDIVREVRLQMFERLQGLSAGWFGRRQQGEVMSRVFSDVFLLEQGLSQVVVTGIASVVQLGVSAVMLFKLNARLAVITLVGAPVVAVVYRLMSEGVQKRSMAVQEETGNSYNVVGENYQALPVVRAFSLQDREIGRFRRASDDLFRKVLRLHLYSGVFNVFVGMVITTLSIGVLGYGCFLIIHHQLTIGALMAFTGLMGTVISPVTSLANITRTIQESSGALVRINEILDSTPEIADVPGAAALPRLDGEIRLADVSFSYTPERRTLEEIGLTIPAGSRVAFVGPTGAGKSSVLGLLMRNYDPDEGAVLFDGQDIRDIAVESLRGQLGVVFQESFLFDATVRENIALGNPGADNAQIEEAARAAELHDFIMTMPRAYDTLVGERGGRLSGGQRQRLAIARALVRDPRVLLLDEATSALDPRTERLIADTLDRVSAGRTTIAVTHRLTSITNYDRIFVLVQGRLVEAGTHDELVRRGGVYAMLWAEQTGAAPPMEAPFDALGALFRIPLFTGLGPADLAEVAARLQAGELSPGQRLPEGTGRLFIVRHGRSRVLLPTLGGELAPVAELGPGDAFGMNALLGQERGAMLEAVDHTSLLVLDQAALSDLATRFPTIGNALTGTRAPSAAPAGGQRLERVSVRLERPPATVGL